VGSFGSWAATWIVGGTCDHPGVGRESDLLRATCFFHEGRFIVVAERRLGLLSSCPDICGCQ
jgi:hypothetical protein